MPVNCVYCKKYDVEDKTTWNGWTHKNEYYFTTFMIANSFGVLPRKGGIDDQDPKLLDILILLKTLFDKQVDLNSKTFQIKLLGAMHGR